MQVEGEERGVQVRINLWNTTDHFRVFDEEFSTNLQDINPTELQAAKETVEAVQEGMVELEETAAVLKKSAYEKLDQPASTWSLVFSPTFDSDKKLAMFLVGLNLYRQRVR